MKDEFLFLDYLWDLQPNYFDIKHIESDISFNRKALNLKKIDDVFIYHLNNNNIFLDKPIQEKKLLIGLTSKGGEIWEKKYQVDWSQYLYFEIIEKDKNHQEVCMYSINKDLIFKIFPEHKKPTIEKLKNWNVTYWKILSDVHCRKLYFNLEDDMELWNQFHQSDLPKWREKL
ncbi:hypothetical protein FW754_08070 [Acinetobacter sp. 1207_04]|uniref:hypothetical protein n=1 Tax=Acinetobacter sp. 1207_04 TaxID=2604449 RepID=UPI004057F62B